MNSIPKEANFLAGSGGSGSGYGGGWDSVQRFDLGSVGSGCLGRWEPTQALPEEKAHLPPFCPRCRRQIFFWSRGWDISHSFPKSMQGFYGPDFCGWFQSGLLPNCVTLPPPLCLLSLPKEPGIFLGVGGGGELAVRMPVGGSVVLYGHLRLLVIRQEQLALWNCWNCSSWCTSGHWGLQHAHS